MIVKDPKTGEPTGMIRNAYSALRGVPREATRSAPKELREGVITPVPRSTTNAA